MGPLARPLQWSPWPCARSRDTCLANDDISHVAAPPHGSNAAECEAEVSFKFPFLGLKKESVTLVRVCPAALRCAGRQMPETGTTFCHCSAWCSTRRARDVRHPAIERYQAVMPSAVKVFLRARPIASSTDSFA